MKRYENYILSNVPRLLSQVDRNKYSETFGCFDRNFWNYKISDFPSIILQQGGLALGLLYKNNFEENIYFNNENIKDISIASVYFWANNQLSDGSFNEYYPNEHGYPPTVFSLYAMSELCRMFSIEDSNVRKAIIKSCRYLSKNEENGALNQEVAAITALYSSYLTTKEGWILNVVNKKFENVLKKQNQEGWFSEYGGVDIGYLTVSLNYMAEYFRLSSDERALDSCKKMIDFLKYFVHPDGSVGGEYGNRNTIYVLPNGFEITGKYFGLAHSVIDNIQFPDSIDDRYISHYILVSFIQALINKTERQNKEVMPFDTKVNKKFENGNIFVRGNEKFYFICNMNKGGNFRLFLNGKEIMKDNGYVIFLGNRKYVSGWSAKNSVKFVEGTIGIDSTFYHIKQFIPSPFKHFVIRMGSKIFGKKIMRYAKNKIITRNEPFNVKFSRYVTVNDDKIDIIDKIESKKRIDKLFSSNFSFKHVSSSNFFKGGDLLQNKEVKLTNLEKALIKRNINLKNGDITFSYQP